MKTTETGERPMVCVDCCGDPPLLGDEEELDLANEVRGRVTLKEPLNELESDPRTLIYEAYFKELNESEGFDVGDYRERLPDLCGLVSPADCSKEELAEEFNRHAESAIELYNKRMDAKFKFVEVEKANCSYNASLITFTAREDENDEPVQFQAIVAYRIEGEIVILSRQKGKPNEGYMEFEASDCSDAEEDDDEGCSED